MKKSPCTVWKKKSDHVYILSKIYKRLITFWMCVEIAEKIATIQMLRKYNLVRCNYEDLNEICEKHDPEDFQKFPFLLQKVCHMCMIMQRSKWKQWGTNCNVMLLPQGRNRCIGFYSFILNKKTWFVGGLWVLCILWKVFGFEMDISLPGEVVNSSGYYKKVASFFSKLTSTENISNVYSG